MAGRGQGRGQLPPAQQPAGPQAQAQPIFARNPARYSQQQPLNFGLKADVELYNKGMAPLAGDPYDGTNLRTFLAVQDRRSQNSDMMFQCLRESINDETHTKVANTPDDYTFEVNGETVEDGPCFLKAVIDATYTNTLTNTAVARQNLASLDAFVDNLPDSNVTERLTYSRV